MKYDLLILCSSTKDRLVLKKSFRQMGWNASAVNATNEGSYIPLIRRKDYLKNSIAKRIVALYDSDDAGYHTSVVVADHLGIEYIDMRGVLAGSKDFSDYVEKGTYEELQTILKAILN